MLVCLGHIYKLYTFYRDDFDLLSNRPNFCFRISHVRYTLVSMHCIIYAADQVSQIDVIKL